MDTIKKSAPSILTPEQQDAIKRSMSRAGIAIRYHGPENSIKNFGKAGMALDARMDDKLEFMNFIKSGRGFNIRGDHPNQAYDFAVIAARAMRTQMIDVRVTNLIGILENVSIHEDENREPRFQNFDAAMGLMITRFVEPMDTLPFKRSDFYRMESWIFGLMEEGYSISVQYSGSLEKSGWWSEYLIDRLKSQNEDFAI